jgi:hypothetical protein
MATTAIGRLQSKGVIDEVVNRAEPTVRRVAEVGVCAAYVSSAVGDDRIAGTSGFRGTAGGHRAGRVRQGNPVWMASTELD